MLAFCSCRDVQQGSAGLCGVRILELGCGAGLCALAAAQNGAYVLATDGVEDAVRMVTLSAQRNGLACPTSADRDGSTDGGDEGAAATSGWVETGVVDWFHPEASAVPSASFPLLIGSDILFFRGTVSPVSAAVARFLAPVRGFCDPCMRVLVRRSHNM
jgi:predicted nicotinamide N-methyase